MVSEHFKALTPHVENGFWKLGGKVLDHLSYAWSVKASQLT